ncbi:hypothetical protein D6764_04275 [Candidatus Woesearchaeota archaeon]|nr:MAG: hypothetical protein D6764_04275 [Candidatus Woesearchaeota archaeon]
MKKLLIIGLVLVLALVSGCKQNIETAEPAGSVHLVQVMLEEGNSQPEMGGVISETLRVDGNQLDPEVIKAPKGKILELTMQSDRTIYLAFPDFGIEEKLVAEAPVTIRIPLNEKGTFEFYCVNGCDIPVTGEIVVY